MKNYDNTEAQPIIDTAIRSATPNPLDREQRWYSIVTPNGDVEVIDVEDYDNHRERPRRKSGTVRVQDAQSFVAYLAKHGLPETEVWADTALGQLVAVVNAHSEGDAGWGDHRVTLDLHRTTAWDTWIKFDRRLLSQTEFAEHVEERLIDIVRPPAADMLELAQTFQATVGVNFESSKQLSSGQRQLEYKETVDARAGRRGQMSIPKDFELGLIPFEGADAYRVTARFRYRISDGTLRVGYVLDRPEDVLRMAFLDIVNAVEAEIDQPVFRGAPNPGVTADSITAQSVSSGGFIRTR